MIKTTLILASFLLSSCDQNFLDAWYKIKEQAIQDARESNYELREAYLNCYALTLEDKRTCMENLKNQYINQKWHNNIRYINAFQYEAERRGFLNFLELQGLNCDYIDQGPKFINSSKAYKILCRNGNNFFMQFDYDINKWELMKSPE